MLWTRRVGRRWPTRNREVTGGAVSFSAALPMAFSIYFLIWSAASTVHRKACGSTEPPPSHCPGSRDRRRRLRDYRDGELSTACSLSLVFLICHSYVFSHRRDAGPEWCPAHLVDSGKREM